MYDDGNFDVLFSKKTIAGQWEQHMKMVTSTDVQEASQSYKGSSAEETDITREFIRGNGSMTHLLNNVAFMRLEDESRMIQIVKRLMESGKISKSIKIKKIPSKK